MVKLKFIIDRFENEIAVVELDNKEMVDIPRKVLPKDTVEGDIINISIEKIETDVRKKNIQDKFNSMFSE